MIENIFVSDSGLANSIRAAFSTRCGLSACYTGSLEVIEWMLRGTFYNDAVLF